MIKKETFLISFWVPKPAQSGFPSFGLHWGRYRWAGRPSHRLGYNLPKSDGSEGLGRLGFGCLNSLIACWNITKYEFRKTRFIKRNDNSYQYTRAGNLNMILLGFTRNKPFKFPAQRDLVTKYRNYYFRGR